MLGALCPSIKGGCCVLHVHVHFCLRSADTADSPHNFSPVPGNLVERMRIAIPTKGFRLLSSQLVWGYFLSGVSTLEFFGDR